MKPEILDNIRMRFLERCRNDLNKLREFRSESTGRTADDTFMRTVHGLAGAGGTLGFPEISRQASDLETLLLDPSSTEVDWRHALDVLIAALEHLTDAKPPNGGAAT